MAENLSFNYYDVVAVVLFGIGFATLMMNRNLFKKIIGLNIADSAVFLILASKGFVGGRAAPIIRDGVLDASAYINPIPTGLILTGIVISVSVTAFGSALLVSLYKRYNSLDLDVMMRLAAKEDGESGNLE